MTNLFHHRESLLALSSALKNATDISTKRFGTMLANDSRFFYDLAAGRTVRQPIYERTVARISAIWPAGLDWPAGIERPAPADFPDEHRKLVAASFKAHSEPAIPRDWPAGVPWPDDIPLPVAISTPPADLEH